MIDATSGSVIDERPAGTAELMVKTDAGGQSEQPDQDPHRQVLRGAGAVTLQRKYVFAGPKHRFDPLADGSKVGPAGLLIGSGRPDDGATQRQDLLGEVLARISFVADDGLPAFKGTGEHEKCDLPFRPVGRRQLDRSGSAVRGAEQMEAAPQNQRE